MGSTITGRGRITWIPRRPEHYSGAMQITDGPDEIVGQEVYFLIKETPAYLRKNVLVYFAGSIKSPEGRKKTPVLLLERVKPVPTSATYEALTKNELHLSRTEQELEITPKELTQKILTNTDFANLHALLSEFGCDFMMSLQAYDFLKARADFHEKSVTELVQEYPWVLLQVDNPAMNIRLAKAIAQKQGRTGEESKKREILGAAIAQVLNAARQGDCYVPSRQVYARMAKESERAKISWNPERFRELLKMGNTLLGRLYATKDFSHLAKADPVYRDKDDNELQNSLRGIALGKVLHAEKDSAVKLANLATQNPNPKLSALTASSEYLAAIRNLDESQAEALTTIFVSPVTFVVGAAGYGKSKVLQEAAKIASANNLKVVILSPTAIAAWRASQDGPEDSTYGTIHRFLRISYEEDDIVSEKVVIDAEPDERVATADLVLVDEMSMCTILMFDRLMTALGYGTHVAFFGDNSQLPALGPTGFFDQIIRMRPNMLPVITLKTNHAAKHSELSRFADMVRKGTLLEDKLLPYEGTLGDHIYQVDRLTIDGLKDLARTGQEILFLAPTRKNEDGCIGTDQINLTLQDALNASGEKIPGTSLRVGDPVIAKVNDYYRAKRKHNAGRHEDRVVDVYNGSVGRIVGYDEKADTVWLKYIQVENPCPYTTGELEARVELAYGTTIHKAQGGRADYVVVFCRPGMTRNHLYTAITRARKGVLLVGAKELLVQTVESEIPPRKTHFCFHYFEATASQTQPDTRSKTGSVIVVAEQ